MSTDSEFNEEVLVSSLVDENALLKQSTGNSLNYETIPIQTNTTASWEGTKYAKSILNFIFGIVLSVICICEIIILSIYFVDDPDSPNICAYQPQFAYYILAKLLYTIIFVSWSSMTNLLECGNTNLLSGCAFIAFIVLIAWSVILSFEAFNEIFVLLDDEQKCGPLIHFMAFELITMYFAFATLLCYGCCNWFAIHHKFYSSTYSMY